MMPIFEWLFERHNSSPAGSINLHGGHSGKFPPVVTIIFATLALAVLAFPFYLAGFPLAIGENLLLYMIILTGEIVYLILGYYIDAQPDSTNIRWMGAVFDNPFRISDDINRMLMLLKVPLFPGRLISIALLNFLKRCSRIPE